MDDSITTVRLSSSITALRTAQEAYKKEQEKMEAMDPLERANYRWTNYKQSEIDSWERFGAAFSAEAAERTAEGFSSGVISTPQYFSAFNTKLDDLDNKVSNMQIVMDTGALVGATSPAMNEALGTASSYSNYTSRSTITRR